MSTETSTDYRAALEAVIAGTIAPAAAEVDRAGTYPRAALDALGAAGILGLLSATEVGGGGGTLGDAAEVIEQIAAACGSTAMVVLMHYAATCVLEAHGPREVREAIARGEHVSSLAFSEAGSRSHFWAPVSTATGDGAVVRLDARKSWITSAGEADSYVWSSRPLAADGPMTLWLVPADADGLRVAGQFDGVGLRGNASRPVVAEGVEVPREAMLGDDGAGLDIALGTALPAFLTGNAAFSVGLTTALLDEAATHLTNTRLEHLDQTLAEQPVARAEYARLRTRGDEARAFLADTLGALASGRADATLRVLQVKAVASEVSSEVADGVMRLCGGAAFRKELGVERRFRDTLAARVMAPTTPALRDFVGRATLGLPLFGGPR
ncbi:alkylation response protein AidB-like acyl-CoA dehydrogenase [Asanoa ferruginea]|uniref:Alkylation response protein AidB-like acyl-CoA dehydrogenase n=1 Tax=Asanoa ferruginea TaxID=53367 RepID=A0A3D9ZS27_9ACTN|nr:acyl-CoA dehydrogenase family protein [Asanoa ferruginea]REF99424.1 alkylation response protein AidB-like acyl-CoA dehydrogenase [Asanoa ferruginea]GIF46029.1 acyl-CoA dehydrogenase [Asanoa ferruginea]